jgi:WD40 repeat protein
MSQSPSPTPENRPAAECAGTVYPQEPSDGARTDYPQAVSPESPRPTEGGVRAHIGPYEVLEVLGRGGMGVVYRARHLKLGHEVALKMILAGGLADVQEQARFLLEATAVARLHHPGIVRLLEFGEDQGPFFCLEFIDGGSLRDRIKNGPLPPRGTAALIEKLAQAMQHAHEHGIVHRDLKPANVLLTRRGEPKIADFGLAKQMDAADDLSGSGAILGTPSYMAPEQAEGRRRDVGPTTDVWSLGAILYECLTGQVPFQGSTAQETLQRVIGQEPTPPRRLVPSLPRDLETICLRCLEKDPKKRYLSAAALADDLGRFLRGEPVAARRVGRAERAWRWCRRNPVVAGAAVAVALALLAGAAVSAAFGVQASNKAEEARIRAHEAEENAAEVKRQAKLAEGLRIDAEAKAQAERQARQTADAERRTAEEQRQRAEREVRRVRNTILTAQLLRFRNIVEKEPEQAQELLLDEAACPPEARDFAWGFCYRLGRNPDRVLKGTTEAPFLLAFSADGGKLASGDRVGTVNLWETETGRERFAVKAHDDGVNALAISPDGNTLASAGLDGAVKVWDLIAGQERATIRLPWEHVHCLRFGPDGSGLAFAASSSHWWKQESAVVVWDVRNGQQRFARRGRIGSFQQVAFTPDGGSLVVSGTDSKYDREEGLKGDLLLFDLRTGRLRASFRGPFYASSLAVSPDGKALASVVFGRGGSQTVLWSLDPLQPRHTIEGAGLVEFIRTVHFSADGRTLVSAGTDGTLKNADAESGAVRSVFLFGQGGLLKHLSFVVSPDGRLLATTDRKGQVLLWNTRTDRTCTFLAGHHGDVRSVCLDGGGQTIASAGADGIVHLWDWQAARERAALQGHAGEIRCVRFSPDGKTVAGAGADGAIKLWDTDSGQERASPGGHDGAVNGLCFDRDGAALASAGTDGTVRLWDVRRGAAGAVLRGHQGSVAAVRFRADGKVLASAGADRTVRLWDAASGRLLRTLERHTEAVTDVCFSPDGATLASAGADGSVRLWDADSGKLQATLRKHTGAVFAVCFSPNGRTLVSAGEDWSIRLWDPETFQERVTLEGHVGAVRSLSFSADGTRLASGGNDETVRLWQASFPDPR